MDDWDSDNPSTPASKKPLLMTCVLTVHNI